MTSGLVGLEEDHRGAIFITLYQRYDLSLLMLTLITWLTNVVRLLHCKVTFFKPSLPYCTLWKKITMYSPQLRIQELSFTSLRVKHLHKLSEILLFWKCLFSHLSIESFVYIRMVWTHRDEFYILCFS